MPTDSLNPASYFIGRMLVRRFPLDNWQRQKRDSTTR